VFFFFGPVS